MKIINFSKTKLRVPAHIKVMERFNTRLKDVRFDHGMAATLLAQFDAALLKETDDYKRQQGSDLTKQITEADNKRDRAWGTICTVSRTFGSVGTLNQQIAAASLMRIINTYKIDVNTQMDVESGLLDQAISDIEKSQIDLDALSLSAVFADLKESTRDLDALLDKRDNERADNVTGVMKADRLVTDAAYDALVDFINAMSLLFPTEALQTFVSQWNSVVNRVRQNILHDAPLSTDGKVDVDFDSEEEDKPVITNPDEDVFC